MPEANMANLSKSDAEFIRNELGYVNVGDFVENLNDDLLLMHDLMMEPYHFAPKIRKVYGETTAAVEGMIAKADEGLRVLSESDRYAMDVGSSHKVPSVETERLARESVDELTALGARRAVGGQRGAALSERAAAQYDATPDSTPAIATSYWDEPHAEALSKLFNDTADGLEQDITDLTEVMMPLMRSLREVLMENDEPVVAAKGLIEVLSNPNPTAAFVKGAHPGWSLEARLRGFE